MLQNCSVFLSVRMGRSWSPHKTNLKKTSVLIGKERKNAKSLRIFPLLPRVPKPRCFPSTQVEVPNSVTLWWWSPFCLPLLLIPPISFISPLLVRVSAQPNSSLIHAGHQSVRRPTTGVAIVGISQAMGKRLLYTFAQVTQYLDTKKKTMAAAFTSLVIKVTSCSACQSLVPK